MQQIEEFLTYLSADRGFSPLTVTTYRKALENFKVENGKITESWGYWPDKEIEQKLKSE